MASYGNYQIFPMHLLESTSGGRESNTTVIQTRGSEARNRNWTRRRLHIDLQGMKMTPAQHEDFQAFLEICDGQYTPFLFRDYRNYSWTDEQFGTGDGADTTFQLTKSRTRQGVTKTYNVNFPDQDYPDQTANGIAWNTQLLTVKVNGVTKTLTTDYTVARETGIITFGVAPTTGHAITVTGYYYTLCRFDRDWIPTKPMGGGAWIVSEGGIIEPKSGV